MNLPIHTLITDILLRSGPVQPSEILLEEGYRPLRSAVRKSAVALKRARRLELGPHFTLLFENRATVWMQAQEEIGMMSDPTAERVGATLDACNLLLPRPRTLSATLLLDSMAPEVLLPLDVTRPVAELKLQLTLDGIRYAARAPGEPLLDAVTYLRFVAIEAAEGAADEVSWCADGRHRVGLPLRLVEALRSELAASM